MKVYGPALRMNNDNSRAYGVDAEMQKKRGKREEVLWLMVDGWCDGGNGRSTRDWQQHMVSNT